MLRVGGRPSGQVYAADLVWHRGRGSGNPQGRKRRAEPMPLAAAWRYGDLRGQGAVQCDGQRVGLGVHGSEVGYVGTQMTDFGKPIPIADARGRLVGKPGAARRSEVRRRCLV